VITVEGVDMAAGAYRVSVEEEGRRIRGLVPEALLGGTLAGRPSHQCAHEKLAAHARPIRAALLARAEGRRPRSPWDGVTLVAP
jgi:hypothetical protein